MMRYLLMVAACALAFALAQTQVLTVESSTPASGHPSLNLSLDSGPEIDLYSGRTHLLYQRVPTESMIFPIKVSEGTGCALSFPLPQCWSE